jgi:DNA-binding response OmpR family regulator
MAPRYTILIADDEPGVRQLVHLTIASDAYLVLEAVDGDDAWDTLQVCRPDVVLLDVRMPGRDGFALTRAIRADPLLAATRVILLTGRHDPDAMAQGRAAGADHYLTKPFSPLHLLATIAACVEAAREHASGYSRLTDLAPGPPAVPSLPRAGIAG